MNQVINAFLQTQYYLCNWFDKLFPAFFNEDGNQHFLKTITPSYLKTDITVYDVGGGSVPIITQALKNKYHIKTVGVDESIEELEKAKDFYDEIIVADIQNYNGNEDADLVICQSVLEHVQNAQLAFKGIVSCLKPGGNLLIFCPSKNAWFAKLNRWLPQKIKMKLVNLRNPHLINHQGFKAYYHNATIKDFTKIAADNNLQLAYKKAYYISNYFQIFFPLYVFWRLYVYVFYLINKEAAAETFTLVFTKQA